ncbi:hypothetical protein K1719_025501 [Acacia pycnantha]|nr:hypothetical protein K1719_025501 [Acacia pycnantha]
MRSSHKEKLELDDAMIQEQALAAAILFKQHQQNGTLPSFNRSTSLRYLNAGSKKVTLPRSSSSRARSQSPSAMTSKEILHKIKIHAQTKPIAVRQTVSQRRQLIYKNITCSSRCAELPELRDATGTTPCLPKNWNEQVICLIITSSTLEMAEQGYNKRS